jgi:hypothetical protein
VSKTIDTLAADIKGLFGQTLVGDSHTFEQDVLAKFGSAVALHVQDALTARTGKRKPNTLYMSEIGKPCKRQVWYGVWHPELAESMQEHTLYKFLYGNVIEEIALLLAAASGHTVTHQQLPVEWEVNGWKIRGRQDAAIDGVLVDVKSCSPFGYKKFEEGLNNDNDSFGYRLQLDGYNADATWDRQGFLAIDKQNGHVGFFEQPVPQPYDVEARMIEVVAAVDCASAPPRAFPLVPEGKSGNEKLGVECSYCPYKRDCWPGLRTFASSRGPLFLGTVKREPNMFEIKSPAVHPTITIHKAVYSGPAESSAP